jgi:asparagine synthase (glutamine-hydrolysing)
MSAEALPVEATGAAVGARRQIGGIVGSTADELTLLRLGRTLGPGGAVLAPPRTRLVAEWDACVVDGVPLRDWHAVLSQGRLAAVEGAFAVAWIDGAGSLHLARDGVGERSLFYAARGEGLAFASTVRALVVSRATEPVVNRRALPAYLTYGYVPGRDTLVQGVYELLPGEHATFAGGRVRTERFWSLPPEDEEPRPDDEYRDELRALLEAAVARRLPETGPLAATLSGGIDSSLVVALARRLYDGPLTTYSVSFGRGVPNEITFASLVADHCRVPHRVVDLTPRTVMDRFDSTLGALSTPVGEPLTVANTLLFETIAPHAPVVLNGEGGDPCFGGPKNVPMLLRELYGPVLGSDTTFHRERGYLLAHRKCFDELHRMLAPDVAELLRAEPLEVAVAPHLSDVRWPTLVNRLTALNVVFKGGHHILPKVDHLSRAGGTIGRSPLFDRAVVEAAARMPAHLKLRGSDEKLILKRAVDDLLPREIVERRKSGMRVPVEAWLEGRFERFACERILDGLAPHGLLQRGYVEELVRPRGAPIPRRGAKIWLLLSLEAWLRTVLEAPAA